MNLAQLIQVGVHWADLVTVDSHFTATGIRDVEGCVHLKAALIALANVADFELKLRSTYKLHRGPSAVIKPLYKNLEFAKYLRNKFVGHIHSDLVGKAIEWQPALRQIAGRLGEPKYAILVNLWLLETAINTYLDEAGKHKFFDSETDLLYPPDCERFLGFLEITVRGSIAYLKALNDLWAPKLRSDDDAGFDLELAMKAGMTKFKYLAQ
ncbi:hypothetical protein [Paraburkholderia megapolitana]|uniref:HEPN AbiU2-like domain-containing protein n=1 Tax=Paraburkholderia megapolitana TaxID=420953 RepID=A0A1I3SDC6_9BURK|nr:hypothetical protein [Paraburkholderia megapolitana]QDQ85798.1 hypothetical protein FNZ07_33015 [Paraburkholderia megapolitana]SFJ55537.1 hypothetical protein SAMN05192543_108104 [Paraburkholderia megapolitana]